MGGPKKSLTEKYYYYLFFSASKIRDDDDSKECQGFYSFRVKMGGLRPSTVYLQRSTNNCSYRDKAAT